MLMNGILIITPLLAYWPADQAMNYEIIGKHSPLQAKLIKSAMKESGATKTASHFNITVHKASFAQTSFLLYPQANGLLQVMTNSDIPAKIIQADLAINAKRSVRVWKSIVREQMSLLKNKLIGDGR